MEPKIDSFCLSILVNIFLAYLVLAAIGTGCFFYFSSECPEIKPYLDYKKIRLTPRFVSEKGDHVLSIQVSIDSIEYLSQQCTDFDWKSLAARSCVTQKEVPGKYAITDIDVYSSTPYHADLLINTNLDRIVKINEGHLLSNTIDYPWIRGVEGGMTLHILKEPKYKDTPIDIIIMIHKEDGTLVSERITNIIWSKGNRNFL